MGVRRLSRARDEKCRVALSSSMRNPIFPVFVSPASGGNVSPVAETLFHCGERFEFSYNKKYRFLKNGNLNGIPDIA